MKRRRKNMIRGIFVRNDGPVPYADKIVSAEKPIETRSRNMLKQLVGHPVVIISTGRGRKPECIGYVWITSAEKRTAEEMDALREQTLIPAGSEFDTGARWCYTLSQPKRFKTPLPLPEDAVRHGRSWAEWWTKRE